MVYFNDNIDEVNVTLEQLYDILIGILLENEVKDDDEYCVS